MWRLWLQVRSPYGTIFSMATLKFYRRVKAPPDYPGKTYNNGVCLLHHLVWWQNTGELVPDGFVLHHMNEDKFDNRFENLELLSNSEHCRQHRGQKAPKEHLICPACGCEFELVARKARARKKQNDTDALCCSFECGVRYRTVRLRAEKPSRVIKHGSPAAYGYHRCRCDACREWKRQDHLSRRAKNLGA